MYKLTVKNDGIYIQRKGEDCGAFIPSTQSYLVNYLKEIIEKANAEQPFVCKHNNKFGNCELCSVMEL